MVNYFGEVGNWEDDWLFRNFFRNCLDSEFNFGIHGVSEPNFYFGTSILDFLFRNPSSEVSTCSESVWFGLRNREDIVTEMSF